ncbi:helix-turn-helix transcriptional regulator [Psychrobacter sp. NG27]|uniref:helix-turn-helix transcriptional regulator n=1 Tax=Psychrobacter sp. NG27 TaxID=2781966 RepID=UPI0018DF0462|nr:AlpA family phage regulatory protein [Psychrobacter sp. NG27]MBI0427155.1 AlpA family phage regulatory protein [Psychrobacter sp. NG27]
MTDHINIDNPVIAFTDNTPSSTEPTTTLIKHLPTQGMSRATQLLPFLPFGSTTLWAWSRDGRFPAPVKLSPTMTAWHNDDVIAWLNDPTSAINSEV